MATLDLGSVVIACDGTTITCNTDVLRVEDVSVGEDGSVHLVFPLCDVNVSLRAAEWADLTGSSAAAKPVVTASDAPSSKRTRRSSTTA